MAELDGVADQLWESEFGLPAFARRKSYLCEFCGHGKRVHRAEGCRPTGRLCDRGCKRFLPA